MTVNMKRVTGNGSIKFYTPSPSPTIITSGLILNIDASNATSYPGSGTTWTDLSGNGNDITLTGTPTYSSNNGGYISFNGSNQYGSRNVFSGFTANPNYTMASWIQFGNLSIGGGTDAPIIWYGGEAALNVASLDQKGSGLCSLHYTDDKTFSYAPSLNTWYYVAMTYNISSKAVILYINGSSQQTLTHTGTLNITTTKIGIAADTNPARYWTGKIASMHVYNTVLSSADMLQNFNATKTRFGL